MYSLYIYMYRLIGKDSCWEGLGAGGEGDDRGWDGWMTSLTRWTWVWMNSGSWWWTGRPGVLRFMGSQRVGHDWVTDLIWYIQNYDCFTLMYGRDHNIVKQLSSNIKIKLIMKLGQKTRMKLQLAEFPTWAGFYGRYIVSVRPSNQIRFAIIKHVFGTYGGSIVKNPPATAGDTGDVGSIPGSERCTGEGNGNPLEHSCLENPMDRGTWWAAFHGVTTSQTQ